MSLSILKTPLQQLSRDVIEQQCLATLSTTQNQNSSIELVVMADITMEQLQALIDICQLSDLSINAINKRNAKQSYRFSVLVDDIFFAREQLGKFAQINKIEAVLIKDAPQLEQAGLLVMDMDSTTIQIECIDEIATLAGVGEQVGEVTELAMQGKLDFAQSLHQRVATLTNAPESILADIAKNIPLMPGLNALIEHLKKYHWRIAIASGGFTYFSEHLKTQLQLDDCFANTLEIINGRLTGKVLGNVVDASTKAETVTLLQQKYQIPCQQTVAMGDGANDLLMMAQAHLGVAFHAKPIVLSKADACIHFAGLDLLLHWLK